MAKHKYIVKENIMTPGDVMVLTLVPKKIGSTVFNFKPGQYAMLSFENTSGKLFPDHPFSIASAPTQKNYIRFGIKIFGNFTKTLSQLKPGDEINVSGPFGKFVFKEKKHKEIVHLTGGIGITPFVSAARYATDKGLPNRMTMLYSARTIEGATFYNELRDLDSKNPNFKAIFAITQEEISESVPYLEKGFIDNNMILKHVGPVKGKTFMLCGPPRFMQAMEENLKALGVPKKQILQEAFSTTPNLPFRENFKNLFLVYGLAGFLLVFFLNFVYQTDNSKFSTETLLNKKELASTINRAVAERMAGILSLKSTTLSNADQANLNKQLDLQKTIFKQEAVVQQVPVVKQPTPTPAPAPVIPQVQIKPRTTVS